MTINSFYGQRGGHQKFITKRGREFKEYVELSLRNLINTKQIKSFGAARLRFEVDFHFKRIRGKKGLDTDNYIKTTIDCFTGIAFNDDEQIDEVVARRFYEADGDYFVVTITKIAEPYE